jgi:hypothetical protein
MVWFFLLFQAGSVGEACSIRNHVVDVAAGVTHAQKLGSDDDAVAGVEVLQLSRL